MGRKRTLNGPRSYAKQRRLGGESMPMYSFKIVQADGSGGRGGTERGFYRDEPAIKYASSLAKDALVQVWRGDELIATVGQERTLSVA